MKMMNKMCKVNSMKCRGSKMSKRCDAFINQ